MAAGRRGEARSDVKAVRWGHNFRMLWAMRGISGRSTFNQSRARSPQSAARAAARNVQAKQPQIPMVGDGPRGARTGAMAGVQSAR